MVEVHHIVFRSQGGPHEEWNLIALCKLCHMRAHGTHQPTLHRDDLLAMVENGVYGDRRIKSCRTCLNRSKDFVCSVTDELVSPLHVCPSWQYMQ